MSNSRPFKIYGEALESESEEEIDSTVIVQSESQFKQCQGKIVSGEAPESDDENESRNSSKIINPSTSPKHFPPQQKKTRKPQSLLLKKLCERNESLHKNLNNFVSALEGDAANELNATNQKLLKCQLQMQEGIQCLKILNSNLKSLDLKTILTAEYIPVINTEACQR